MSDHSIDAAEQGLDQLRDIISQAKSVPMSASCVVNRADLLKLVDRIRSGLPEELGRAQGVLAHNEAEAQAVITAAQAEAERLVDDHEITQAARSAADKLRHDTERECEDLRRETDVFIDSRMASFESVLHKTASQVATARARLAERSGLDVGPLGQQREGDEV